MSEAVDRGLGMSHPDPTHKTVQSPPPVFDGQEPPYDEWVSKMAIYLGDRHWSSMEEQHQYILSRTSDQAFKVLSTRIGTVFHPTEDPYRTTFEIFEDLEKNFGVHNKQQIAAMQYQQLKQTRGEWFTDFYTKWNTLAVQSGNNRLPEARRIQDLTAALTYKYASAVKDGTHYATLAALVHRLNTLDIGLKELEVTHPKAQQQQPRTEKRTSTTRGQKTSNWGGTEADDKPKRAPMSNQKKLTTEERDRCMREGLCMACFEKGHKAQDRNPNGAYVCQRHPLHSSKTKATAAAVELLDGRPDDSENERS